MATKKNDTGLLPGDDDAAEGLDLSSLRINFSEEEASSEAIDFTPLPTGKYLVAITEVEIKKSTSEKNTGKPYWALTLVVQEGPYENRKLWSNVMLWEGAAFSLAQLMKATNRGDVLKSGKIPSGDELVGDQMIVSVVKTLDKYKMERDGGDEKLFKNEVKGYKPATEFVASSGGGSLLP